MRFKGIPASSGITYGHAVLYEKRQLTHETQSIENVEREIARFHEAHTKAVQEIEDLYVKACNHLGDEEAEIFTSHKMILEDEEFVEGVEEYIKENKQDSITAVKAVEGMFVSMFEAMESDYLKERAIDIKDVCERLINNLESRATSFVSYDKDTILVAEDLTPSDTMSLDMEHVKGFIIQKGGLTSHTAIIAKSLGIPALVGVGERVKEIKEGQELILDGEQGLFILEPQSKEVQSYKLKIEEEKSRQRELLKLVKTKAVSKDGYPVTLLANIGSEVESEAVLKKGAGGVGLLRTEFIFMEKDKPPSEDEQYKIYKAIAENLDNKPLTVRTLDIGGDKEVGYLDIPKEANPFLGYRGIRYCLEHQEFFKNQLKAILRASVYGQLKVMFPMISSIEELRKAKVLLEEAKQELEKNQISYSHQLQVGVMIETPASVFIAEDLAREVDFFSIGTNDLTQYINVADRMNHRVQNLYKSHYPALIRAISHIVNTAHKHQVDISICGEASNDKRLLPLWLSLGVNTLSMPVSAILATKKRIGDIDREQVDVEAIMASSTLVEIEEALDIRTTIK